MIQAENSEPVRRGRPPDELARQHVLATAYRLLVDEGLGKLTIERVAAESGVSKPTIYRNWANAQELAMAAFLANPEVGSHKTRSRSARKALVAHLADVARMFNTPRGRQLTLTMASADPQSELSKAFRNQIILKSRETGRLILEQAIKSAEIRPPEHIETALDMIYGPLFYRLLAGHLPVDEALAEQIVGLLWQGLRRVAKP